MGRLKRIPMSEIPLDFLKGDSGLDGKDGTDGVGLRGEKGEVGKSTRGADGKDGLTVTGPQGLAPEHEIANGELRFRQPDGTWGDWLTLPTSSGGGGKISNNTYFPITTAEYHVNSNQLDLGENIFGVNFAGDVNIFLPRNVDPRSRIIINDESGNAGQYNITVQVEN